MSQFRRKPRPVDAMQYDGTEESARAVQRHFKQCWAQNWSTSAATDPAPVWLDVETADGIVYAHPGYWIVRRATGNFCVFHPDDFAEEYEPVSAAAGSPRDEAGAEARARADATGINSEGLSIICSVCGTLVEGVPAGDKVRFVMCRSCQARAGDEAGAEAAKDALAKLLPSFMTACVVGLVKERRPVRELFTPDELDEWLDKILAASRASAPPPTEERNG